MKHIYHRARQCALLSELSPCLRAKHGAVFIDQESKAVLADGYNGAPRGGKRLCGGYVCERDVKEIPSGQRNELGCHHAEANAICNAARLGVSLLNSALIVTGQPCLMCAKLIHHAGASVVYYKAKGYTTDIGVEYLKEHGIKTVSYTEEELCRKS